MDGGSCKVWISQRVKKGFYTSKVEAMDTEDVPGDSLKVGEAEQPSQGITIVHNSPLADTQVVNR